MTVYCPITSLSNGPYADGATVTASLEEAMRAIVGEHGAFVMTRDGGGRWEGYIAWYSGETSGAPRAFAPMLGAWKPEDREAVKAAAAVVGEPYAEAKGCRRRLTVC